MEPEGVKAMAADLSEADQAAVIEIGKRHGFGPDAARVMLEALRSTGGGMAQFSHPEFGGFGQWMRGGMTMTGSLSDHALKARVDALCNDLVALLAREPAPPARSFQSQSQGSRHAPSEPPLHVRGGSTGAPSLVVPVEARGWWPREFGAADSSGAQDGVRYAYFAGPRRLAIEIGGRVTVYDTRDHRISGVAQPQSRGGSLTFTSQRGTVPVAELPVVS